jgi:hypothetical protein
MRCECTSFNRIKCPPGCLRAPALRPLLHRRRRCVLLPIYLPICGRTLARAAARAGIYACLPARISSGGEDSILDCNGSSSSSSSSSNTGSIPAQICTAPRAAAGIYACLPVHEEAAAALRAAARAGICACLPARICTVALLPAVASFWLPAQVFVPACCRHEYTAARSARCGLCRYLRSRSARGPCAGSSPKHQLQRHTSALRQPRAGAGGLRGVSWGRGGCVRGVGGRLCHGRELAGASEARPGGVWAEESVLRGLPGWAAARGGGRC